MSDLQQQITWTLGTIIALSTVLGLAVRLILLPYLREHLVKPMRQVEKQVTENHHSNPKPTILDRLDDIERAVVNTQAEMARHREDEQARLDRGDARMGRIEESIGHVSKSFLGWRDSHEALTAESVDRIRRLERIVKERRERE